MRMHPTRLPRNWLPTLPQKTDTPKHPSAIPCPSALPASSATPCPSAQTRLVGCFPSLSSPFPPRCRPSPAEQTLSTPLSAFTCRTAPPRPVVGLSPPNSSFPTDLAVAQGNAHPPQRIWFPVRKKLLSAVPFVIMRKIYLVQKRNYCYLCMPTRFAARGRLSKRGKPSKRSETSGRTNKEKQEHTTQSDCNNETVNHRG